MPASRRERLRQLLITGVLLEVVGLVYTVSYFHFGLYRLSALTGVAMLVSAAGPVIAIRTGRLALPAHLMSFTLFVVVATTTFASGGLAEPGYGWVYVIPLVAGLLGGTQALVPWTILSAATTLAMCYGGIGPIRVQMLIPGSLAVSARVADVVFIFSTIMLTMGGFFRTRKLAEAEAGEALRDLAEQVETRRRAEEEARAADRAKSAFLATMSHELRTPMNGVLGMSELLLEMPLGDQQRRFGEVIRSSGEALMSLLNDILDYSKIEAGRMDLESVPFELRPLVEDTVQLVAGRAQEQRLELHVDMPAGMPPVLVGDPARLRQMLLNLLVNAVKFTPRGEVEVKVSRTRDVDGMTGVAISVRDTGIGIDADELRRVFQPFTQANSGVARRFGGTGLGLAISRRIAQEMGGDIQVESVPGVGSTFVITLNLPVAEPQASPPPLAGRQVLVVEGPGRHRELLVQQLQVLGAACTVSSDLSAALRARSLSVGPPLDVMFVDRPLCGPLSSAVAPDGSTRRIALVEWGAFLSDDQLAELGLATQVFKPASSRVLVEAVLGTTSVRPDPMLADGTAIDGPLVLVVDDNVVNRRVAAHYLQRLGYRAVEAGSGQEALDRIDSAPPALVLMDIEMPGMDGYETTRRLRDRETGPGRLPVIALTAHAMAGYREAVLRAGMDDYLTKPIRRAQLAQAIESALRREIPIPA